MTLDRILPHVTRPARYTGGEWNSVLKDWDSTEVRLALVFPDLYEVGMSNMGLSILYELINAQPYVLAERAYTPWPDMEAALRRAGLPLYSLESRHPLSQFDIIGFSLGYELTYTNVLKTLDLAGVPLLASQRGEGHPLVMAGGTCTLNPEPVADFFDLFVIGEGEEVALELLEAYRDWKASGRGGKQDFLERAAAISGVYVPSFYSVTYRGDGTVEALRPAAPAAAERVTRRWLKKLPPPPVRPIVPFVEIIHDRAAIEVQRGCSRGCRFCLAGVVYRPPRERPVEEVLAAADEILRNTGYGELSLLSLSAGDYSCIEPVVAELMASHRQERLAVSLPSLRMDSFSVGLAEALRTGKRTGLTFAPEAGSQRLRDGINKTATEEDLLRAAQAAFERGWRGLKLYFMIGLPGETEGDVEGIARLAKRLLEVGRQCTGRHVGLRINVACFVPKAHTPFQWAPQADRESLDAKIRLLQQGLRRTGVNFSWHAPESSLLEGVLSRGDRRLGRAILRAWELGCAFDAWAEHFRFDLWQQALAECGLEPGFYAHRERPLDEVLPWAHIDPGVSQSFLRREWQRSLRGQTTADCKTSSCAACGFQALPEGCEVERRKG
ncbi:MAG TPA: TIGR03960 family B12-binding radical SAM protein [Dehalococcoidia bacterium]|nr:TIGR03960 family B12-binding radical SAM protein [Dehalococcoidia bacterium]